MKKIIFLTPLIILVFIITMVSVMLYKNSQKQDLDKKIAQGIAVDLPDFSLPQLYNSSNNLSKADLLGSYSILNVFASWCVSCASEHQLLLKISEGKIINIYGVAWRDIDQNTKDYLSKNGNPYNQVAIDDKGTLSKLLAVSGVPESFIINPKGQIIYHQKGPIDQDALRYIISLTIND